MICQAPVARTLQLIKCGVGDETYALDMGRVQTIERPDRLRPGGAGDAPGGFLAVPGGEVEVFSLAARFGRPETKPHAQQHVVVLKSPARNWGLLVDRVSQVVSVPADRVAALPSLVQNPAAPFFQAAVCFGPEWVLLLAPDPLHPRAVSEVASHLDGPGGAPRGARFSPAFESLAGFRRGSPEIVMFATTDADPGERPLTFGLSKSQVLEILEARPLLPVPMAPAFLKGLLDWRTLPVPVVDLGPRFGLPAAVMDRRSRLLMVHTGRTGDVVGLLVRPSIRVIPLPTATAPGREALSVDRELVRGHFELKGETLVIPDLGRLSAGPAP
jgi:purine-binding chemotaxis protein CheW